MRSAPDVSASDTKLKLMLILMLTDVDADADADPDEVFRSRPDQPRLPQIWSSVFSLQNLSIFRISSHYVH